TESQEDPGIEEDLQDILEEPATGETYRYDPQGRRDPFRSLIGPAQKISRENAPPGVPGFLIEELDLQGIIRTQQGLVAMIKGPDNIGYTLRSGDRLFDGEVLRITPDAVVFRQEVNDPTTIERHREVVKELKSETAGRR
ncbi:MAG TPA: pilus assembly protein PilP, partial [Thermoanaerobaculia bacterium]|nr:pilus assembly protein PilP [Thermoanaerobaculia bacterium]